MKKPIRTIKDVLIFHTIAQDDPKVQVFDVAFPFDLNAQSGTICALMTIILHGDAKRQIQRGQWCQPINNPYLGTKVNYVDVPDIVASAIRMELANYNK